MMYEELVKKLREPGKWIDAKEHYSLLKQAADAIEDLTAQLDQAAEYLRDNANALEELNYKYQAALSDLVKQAKPPKEET